MFFLQVKIKQKIQGAKLLAQSNWKSSVMQEDNSSPLFIGDALFQ